MPRGHTVLVPAASPPSGLGCPSWLGRPQLLQPPPAAAPGGVPLHPRTLPSYFWLFLSYLWAPVGLPGAGGSGDASAMPLGEQSCAELAAAASFGFLTCSVLRC